MKFAVGCDLGEFKKYYKELAMDMEWQDTYGCEEDLGIIWERILTKDPSQLIVWGENNKIIGHAIWHESNTEEHRKGVPRDKEDSEILERLLGGKKDFIELHEIWLKKKHRGKGYGKKFFDFFEEFIRNRGYDSIVYYADHPAAIAICRQRGYKEKYWKGKAWYVFYLPLEKNSKG